MKLLADMGVSQTVVKSLREMGYDAKHLREEGLQCLPDPLIIEKAKIECRVILTFDLDFGDLYGCESGRSAKCDYLSVKKYVASVCFE